MNCPECHHRPSGRFDGDGRQCYCTCHDAADTLPAIIETSDKLGFWMSAALDDETTCDEMKADINRWFDALQPAFAGMAYDRKKRPDAEGHGPGPTPLHG